MERWENAVTEAKGIRGYLNQYRLAFVFIKLHAISALVNLYMKPLSHMPHPLERTFMFPLAGFSFLQLTFLEKICITHNSSNYQFLADLLIFLIKFS